MAATTTIGAMLPLAYLGLGRISGFAVVTIIGVIIGVLVTRPAYGSVLRELITEKD
jgi:preprotein translocase subunit SecD